MKVGVEERKADVGCVGSLWEIWDRECFQVAIAIRAFSFWSRLHNRFENCSQRWRSQLGEFSGIERSRAVSLFCLQPAGQEL